MTINTANMPLSLMTRGHFSRHLWQVYCSNENIISNHKICFVIKPENSLKMNAL
ncbi:hypothetical protein MNBD_BACTEROID07-1452 [hydrothermal vent metagenome]|uniref:Uncharacterized protein n=1 Tax=hydrothermal vent metagenome TaxID=652676 RepID=A0A3B0UHJ7_9ZZZZ